MNTLLVIDGNAIMHRAFHAIPAFQTRAGLPTNVVYGFVTMLHKAVVDFSPQRLVVCFDTPAPTFRNRLYDQYQIQRPKIADDFITQIPLVKQALDAAKIHHLEKDGFEADDLIGTIAVTAANLKTNTLILSGDKDILQLVNQTVLVAVPQAGLNQVALMDADAVKKKLGVLPRQIPDLKALMGDPSDNYPGAKGIGPKTAAKLIDRFGDVSTLLKHLDEVTDPRLKDLLTASRDKINLSHQLATIKTDVEIDFRLDDCRFTGFNDALKQYLLGLEMAGLVKRLYSHKNAATSVKKTEEEPPQMSLF
ncbi:hypothetical protein M1523_01215 [Patescibacteria group bacterium]|nr:hypothetical protein [Patescibacteria group bacterium]MCL5091198.1 hypothetical protein [Patescibacteria group bacterium]